MVVVSRLDEQGQVADVVQPQIAPQVLHGLDVTANHGLAFGGGRKLAGAAGLLHPGRIGEISRPWH